MEEPAQVWQPKMALHSVDQYKAPVALATTKLRPHTATYTKQSSRDTMMLGIRNGKPASRPKTAGTIGNSYTYSIGNRKGECNSSKLSSIYSNSMPENPKQDLDLKRKWRSQTPNSHSSNSTRRYSLLRPMSANNILSSRGTEYTDFSGKVDIVKKVRAQSCRRRSARLSSDVRRKIVETHRQTAKERIFAYYQLLKEKKAQEVDLLLKKTMAVKRFSTAIWKVRWIIRWKRAMIAISMDNISMTAMEMDWHTRNTDSSVSQFKREDFSRSKVASKVPTWAEKILRKPPEWRTTSDCNRLHALMRPLKSFEKFTEKIQKAMCRALRYEFVDAKRIILRKGHPGLCFYFIYSGSTFVNVEDTNTDNETFVKTATILHRGESFGNIAGISVELALLRDTNRTATITCREDCELLTVDNEVFAKACPAIFEQEMHEKIHFIKELPIFVTNLWGSESLQSICFEGQIKQYKNDQVIVADSTGDDWMYICMEGKCKVVKSLVLKNEPGVDTFIKTKGSEQEETISNLFSNITNENSYREEDRKSSTTSEASRGSNFKSMPNTSQNKTALNKVQMLNSMAVEWFRVHEQVSAWLVTVHNLPVPDPLRVCSTDLTGIADMQFYEKVEEIKQRTRDQCAESNNLISGMRSLSSLMRDISAKARETGDEAVFIQVAEVHPQDIFDLQSILWRNDKSTQQRPLMLVSCGAKMLRLKRNEFFRSASFEALEYIKTITAGETYPSDSEMLQKYKVVHDWRRYRQTTLTNTMIAQNSPSDKKRKTRMESIHTERHFRDAKLLKALKRNEVLEQKNQQEAEVCQQRVTFLFELEKAAKAEVDEPDRDSTSGITDGLQMRRARRLSAEGLLPNLVEQMVLDSSSKVELTCHTGTAVESKH